METTVQLYGVGAALILSMTLSFVIVSIRQRRRNARRRQAEQQAAYDVTVTGYRKATEHGLLRRAQLLELLEVAFAARTDRALTSAGSIDIDTSVSRLYLDLALAGEDHLRREAIFRVVRRGISDIEMLMPEVPLPPAPVARLGRRARRTAQEWLSTRTAELENLRSLPLHPTVDLVPSRPAPAPKPATEQPVGRELAIAS